MIDANTLWIIKDKIITRYITEYKKIGILTEREGYFSCFDSYRYNIMLGTIDCFIIYREIGDNSCFIVDILSTTGGAYKLWGQLVNKYDIILATSFDNLPVVKRTYKKLGGIGTGIYNKDGQQVYLFNKG